ncbi:MAG: COQ9 family protein [Rhodospirillaceae bacterium]
MTELRSDPLNDPIAQAKAEKVAQKDAVLRAALPNIPFDGWTIGTLETAAEKEGLGRPAAHRLFPGGPRDAVTHWRKLADRLMLEDLGRLDLGGMKIRERIATGVRLHLERWTPYREAIRAALALSPLPPYAGDSLRGWYNTVDAIWRAAGDTSTDYNFYTKRGLLAGVYATTLLYWLNDRSEGTAETWKFLDRRIQNVMEIPKLQKRIADGLRLLPDPRRLFNRVRERASGYRRRTPEY